MDIFRGMAVVLGSESVHGEWDEWDESVLSLERVLYLHVPTYLEKVPIQSIASFA